VGYDSRRKRHIAVDADGHLLMVRLIPVVTSDSAGAQFLLDGISKRAGRG
jgi:hypothetical protein